MSKSLLSILALTVLSLFVPAEDGFAQKTSSDYRLGAQDRVRVKVFEWRPSRDEIFEWKALNDEYVVGTSGKLSLPIIGEVAASGLLTSELARSIGERMIAGIGLVEMPTISVEIVKFRPFYITGRVQTPGEYSYRPGLTAIQALSLAGGLERKDKGLRLDREAIAGQGDVEILGKERAALLARRARIEADLKSPDGDIEFPGALRDSDPTSKVVMEQERDILRTLREAFNSQIVPMKRLEDSLSEELKSLSAQLATHDAKARLAAEELGQVEDLMKKQLTVAPRRMAAKRNVYQLDGDRIQLELGQMKVRQEISKAEFTVSELRSKRAQDIAVELRSTQAKLDEVQQKYSVARQLLMNTSETDGQETSENVGDLKYETVFKISRVGEDGEGYEQVAGDSTPVQPGDTIKVESRVREIPVARK